MSAATEAPPRRAVRGWIWIAAVIVVVGGLGALLASNQWQDKDALDPDGFGPSGTRALAEILRQQGVEVVVARDRAAVESAVDDASTLVMPDPVMLSDSSVEDLAALASDTVVIDPTARIARVLFGGSQPRGFTEESVEPDCEQPDARRAGAVAPGRLVSQGSFTVACYPVGDGFGLLQRDDPGSRLVLVDGRALFTNDSLAEGSHAALAIGLLGSRDRVVWYVPSLADSDRTGDPSIGELTPPWVTPVLVLLAITAVVAGLWRGRRFGPLVAENLPVTVRASETMEGRARLAERSGDAAGALDVLRSDTTERVARLLALGPTATRVEIADAAAVRLGVDRAVVRGILIDPAPPGPAALVAAADRLSDLEDAVRRSVRDTADPSERNRT